MAIAYGEKAFGTIEVDHGSIIFLTLEDTLKRLQIRLQKMIPGKKSEATDKLRLMTEWDKIDNGGMAQLEQEIIKYDDLRLIVIDTLQRIRPSSGKTDGNVYAKDYEQVAEIKKIADKYSISILLIHHQRKLGADDIFDTISGSFGVTGAADGLLVLKKTKGKTILHIIGRDIEEKDYVLEFDSANLSWNILGDSKEIKQTDQRQKLYDAIKEANKPITPKELCEITDLREQYIYDTLPKMLKEGDIEQISRGKYQFINPDTI